MKDFLASIAAMIGRRVLGYALVFGAMGAFFGCVWIGVWLFSFVETRVDVVNATGAPLTIALDGEVQRTVEHADWILLQPMPGDHRLTATGPGGIVEERTISVGVGSSQVWNVAGAARFAVISRDRTPDGRDVPRLDTVHRFDPPDRVFAFPAEVTLHMVDFQFRVGYGSEHQLGDETTRLCTLWDGDTRLGCESCQQWDSCTPIVMPEPVR